MEFSKNRVFFTGIVVGMVLVFLLAQPFVYRGLMMVMASVYDYLPESLSRFLWNQTFLAITFFWSMIFVGLVLWLIRGDFFAREDFPSDGEFKSRYEDFEG